jgi:ribonuclease-3 family protein
MTLPKTLGLFGSVPAPLPPETLARLSPAALAYVGDAVFELYIRTYYLLPPQRLGAYHQRVVEQVRAETQAQFLETLGPHLTELEQDWVRRGRNQSAKGPRRLSGALYQQATGLETLLGYLYLQNPRRLGELLACLNLPDR